MDNEKEAATPRSRGGAFQAERTEQVPRRGSLQYLREEGRPRWPEQHQVSEGQLQEGKAAKSGRAGPGSAGWTTVTHLDLIACATAKPPEGLKQGGNTISSSE